MNIKILLLAISAAALGSCSTTYKSGQTPDDVYYSPTRAIEKSNQHKENNEVKTTDYEDRQIRMSTYDRRWRNIGADYNYDYSYSPYRYGYDYGYYYNPYYYPCPVYFKGVTITNPRNTTPRMANLRTYTNSTTVITNQKTSGEYQVNSRRAYSNSNTNSGSFIRRVISSAVNNSSNSNRSSTDNNNNNTRTYTPANNNNNSSNSNNSSSGTKSSGSVARPSRGGN